MRAFIVEDVADTRKLIIQLLRDYCPQVSVEGFADNIKDAEQKILKADPDLLLLDIKLGSDTVFDLLKRFRADYNISFLSIIISAYSDFANAREAIQYGVVDFISKPIDPEELQAAVEKARQRLREGPASTPALTGSEQFRSEALLPVRLPHSRFAFLEVDRIQYIQASSNTCNFMLNDGETVRSVDSLAHFKAHPLVSKWFVALSKSLLANSCHLQSYDHRNNLVTLRSGIQLQASRRAGKMLFDQIRIPPQNDR